MQVYSDLYGLYDMITKTYAIHIRTLSFVVLCSSPFKSRAVNSLKGDMSHKEAKKKRNANVGSVFPPENLGSLKVEM